MVDVLQTSFSRMFLLQDRAGPETVRIYESLWRAGAYSWDQGDITTIEIPDPDRYGSFVKVGKVLGARGDPELPMTARFTTDLSDVLRLVRIGCEHDVQVHFGICGDPRDFNGGWEKVLVLEAARISTVGSEELGALSSDENAAVNETATFVGEDMYEIKRMAFAGQAGAEVVREVVAIDVCDRVNCGICGIQSNGCDVVLAVQVGTGASPGTAASAVITADGGNTYDTSNITTLAGNQVPDDAECVGLNYIVVSEDSVSLHYAAIADLKAGTETWAEVTTGFVNGPRAIVSVSPVHTWIVGAGGYIYFSDDPTSGVETQDAGSATVQDLNDVDAYDTNYVAAVGNSNAVVFTTNGGSSWGSVTGPAVGVNLNTIAMHTPLEWFVGAANGRLYYTRDSGTSWEEKGFTGAGTGSVTAIAFSTPSVGWMAHTTAATVGRLFRTIDGGFSWYVAPEGTLTLPDNDGINDIAVCADPNTVFAAGLNAGGVDGVILKGS